MKNSVKTLQTYNHVFAEIPAANIPRSFFDRSHNVKLTLDSSLLVPCYVDEMLPGDTFQCDISHVTRMTTAIVPVMDNIKQDFFAFVCPVRLLWEHAEEFFGAWKDPASTTQYTAPVVRSGNGWANSSLFDYLGYPTEVANVEASALYPRMYNKVYNDWFRKGAVEAEITVDTSDGPDVTNYTLLRRYKSPDYFVSSLPYPQKGPGVSISLAGSARVYNDVTQDPNTGVYTGNNPIEYHLFNSDGSPYGSSVTVPNQGSNGQLIGVRSSNLVSVPRLADVYASHSGNPGNADIVGDGVTVINNTSPYMYQSLKANLSGVSAVTINSLRTAFALQRWEEALARATGGRYIEIIKGFFNVDCPDYRLQRSEFIGKVHTDINMQTVIQTSSTDNVTPQGNLTAIGYGSNYKPLFRYSANEHCILMVLTNIYTDNTYQYGLNRMFSRKTRFDYYWPQFAHLGEQEVLNKEIYSQGTSADDQVWAYQERYAEYRWYPNQICGQFRSNYAQSLDVWHFAQKFNSLPVYGKNFLQQDCPVSRALAVQNYPQFWMDINFVVQAIRPMPVYSVPGLIDHF